jgi:ATP-dependent DNA helicase Q4
LADYNESDAESRRLRTNALQKRLHEYFTRDAETEKSICLNHKGYRVEDETLLTQQAQLDAIIDLDIRTFLKSFDDIDNGELKLISGRVVARIFHGLDSPKYPADEWESKTNLWGKYKAFRFEVIMKRAAVVLKRRASVGNNEN